MISAYEQIDHRGVKSMKSDRDSRLLIGNILCVS